MSERKMQGWKLIINPGTLKISLKRTGNEQAYGNSINSGRQDHQQDGDSKDCGGLKNGRYKIEISSYNTRSLQQNRYYWGLVIPMIQKGLLDMGTEAGKEEVHEFLKARFNYNEVVNKDTGEYVNIPKSTAGLNKEEFGIYIEKIQRFASEFLNIVIPDPNTQLAIDY